MILRAASIETMVDHNGWQRNNSSHYLSVHLMDQGVTVEESAISMDLSKETLWNTNTIIVSDNSGIGWYTLLFAKLSFSRNGAWSKEIKLSKSPN